MGRVGGEYGNPLYGFYPCLAKPLTYRKLKLKKRLREGIVASLDSVTERVRKNHEDVQELGVTEKQVFVTLRTLKEYQFPTWKFYYPLLLEPLLNSLILTMRMTGFSVWGIILWLFLLHLLLKYGWTSIFFAFLRKFPRNKARLSTKEGQKRAQVWSDLFLNIMRFGMGLPVWAALSLVTLPYWENILTLRYHLSPLIQTGLDSHRVFALQEGILWWTKPASPAGFWFAIVFGLFYALAKLPRIYRVFAVGHMTPEEASEAGISDWYYSYAKLEVDQQSVPGTGLQAQTMNVFLVPAAVSFLPFLLALYYLLATIVESLASLAEFMDKKRLSRVGVSQESAKSKNTSLP